MRSRTNTVFARLVVGIAVLTAMGCNRSGGRRDEPETGQIQRPRYGALMSEMGQRFELLGQAAVARRWELAAFELHELEEVFEELPTAQPPEDIGDVDLRGVEQAFINTHPSELDSALTARDSSAFSAAFARAAATCNGCHKTSTHGFIEVPSEPGAPVPKMDPLP